MFEVKITGTFITVISSDNKELSEQEVKKLLEKKLDDAGLLKPTQVFVFEILDIESQKI